MISKCYLDSRGRFRRLGFAFFYWVRFDIRLPDTIGCMYPKFIFTYFDNRRITYYGKSTRKKSSTFFHLFLDNTLPVRIVPVFFEVYLTGISDYNHKPFEARRSWWNPLSKMSEIGNLVWLDLYWLIGSEYLGAIWVVSDGQGEALSNEPSMTSI